MVLAKVQGLLVFPRIPEKCLASTCPSSLWQHPRYSFWELTVNRLKVTNFMEVFSNGAQSNQGGRCRLSQLFSCKNGLAASKLQSDT